MGRPSPYERDRVMDMTRNRITAALAAIPLAAGLSLASAPAQAQWRGPGGPGFGPGFHHGGPGAGPIVGGALLGLGVGALLAAPFVAPPPVVYAPPPPAYYPPPYAYAPPPYYPPPGGYYYR